MRRILNGIMGLAFISLACNITLSAASTSTAPAAAESAVLQVSSTATIPLTTPTATPLPSYERIVCGEQQTVVALLVDPRLLGGIRAGLDSFEADLCAGGYGVVERTLDQPAPPDVRAYLADLFARTAQKLEGAIFIGRTPYAYQSVAFMSGDPGATPRPQEVISFQYYSDLDGEFSASPEYRSPGGHEYSFDVHAGDTDWEIWTAVLPLYRDDETQTVAAVNRYFEKNRRHRSGQSGIPEGFLMITEHYVAKTAAEQANFLNVLRTGQYAWTPLSTAPNASFYFDGPTVSVEAGYAAMSDGAADLTVVEAHGDYTMSGRISREWVRDHPVRTLVFWTGACSVGNLDYPENFLTEIVYNPTSEVLVGYGSTNDSGGVGTNREGFYGHNIAVRVAAGKNLGQAFLGHVNVPLIPPWDASREYHFALSVFIGDPTLRLR